MSAAPVAFADPEKEHGKYAKACKVCYPPPKPQPRVQTSGPEPSARKLFAESTRLVDQFKRDFGIMDSVRGVHPSFPAVSIPPEKRVRVECIAPDFFNAVCDHCAAMLRGVPEIDAMRFQAAHAAIHGMP